MISAAERAWPGAGLSRWVSAGIVALLLGLIPWTAFLAVTLHGRFEARHWDIAWVGFDAVLIVVFAYTAWAAWFRRQILVAAALVAATLLVCDAWFDVTMSLGTPIRRSRLRPLCWSSCRWPASCSGARTGSCCELSRRSARCSEMTG
jgi:hypothetical protein